MMNQLRLPKREMKDVSGPVIRNREKWGFLELFETTMKKDLHTGNPWLDIEAWNKLQTSKIVKKKVRFNLKPTIYIIPLLTEEEYDYEQDERWTQFLESLNID